MWCGALENLKIFGDCRLRTEKRCVSETDYRNADSIYHCNQLQEVEKMVPEAVSVSSKAEGLTSERRESWSHARSVLVAHV